jgi:hypothetical protein
MGNDGKPGLTSTGLLWLVLLGAGALFMRDVPWHGSRPAATEVKRYARATYQDVDARLWQDPMGVVAQAREDLRKREAAEPKATAAPERAGESRNRGSSRLPSALFCDGDASPDKDVLVIGAMVSGAPYPERAEFRRRARYAVLAGLNETGLVPADEEHLGYIVPDHSRATAHPTEKPLPDFIAYEWLVSAEANLPGRAAPAGGARSHRSERVLVLWLDEDLFGDNPKAKIESVAESMLVCPGNGNGPARKIDNAQFVVLGPSSSWPLQAMIAAAKSTPNEAAAEPAIPVAFYAYGATAADADLLAEAGVSPKGRRNSVHKMLKEHDVVLFRTINSDDGLAGELARELALRDVKPAERCTGSGGAHCQHVVLIAERDSFYGRSLPWTVAGKLADPGGTSATEADDYPSWIHAYSYLRGLDGQLPTSSGDTAATAKDDGDSKANAASGLAGDAKQIERPNGQSQYDYLRRLAVQLVALDSDLRMHGNGSIRAIGVLGSDVYDKLLILQALRPDFPNAIVFTTDIDAIYLHPQQLEWTRNAIVASSYGLQLDPALQRDIPPFRDGYQTALFLSTMVAVNHARFRATARNEACPDVFKASEQDCWGITQKKIMRWLGSPRVFEIGRKSAFDFSRVPPPPDDLDGDPRQVHQLAATAALSCSPRELGSCAAIHPSRSAMYPEPAARWLQGAALLVIAGLALLGLANGVWGRVAAWLVVARANGTGARLRMVAIPIVLLAVALAFVAYTGIAPLWLGLAKWLTQDHNGEPIALLQGVSVWPTVLLRLLATALSIWFICRGWRALNANLDEISRTFKWEEPRRILDAQRRLEEASWRPWQRVLRIFSYRLVGEQGGQPVQPDTGLTPCAERFWGKYMYQGRGSARCWRILLATLTYLAAGVFIIGATGAVQSPYRGSLTVHVEPVLRYAAVFAMLLLIFFVVDATLLCYQLVNALRNKLPAHDDLGPEVAPAERCETRWPEPTLNKYAAKLGVDKCYLDDWITMHFVARRTRAVARLVYYPFIVIALMVLSRSSLFDNWTTPVGLVIVVTLSVAIVLTCAILLRVAAERLRRRAIWRLTNIKMKLKARAGEDASAAAQIEVMIAQIAAFDTGAFAPYSQQPIVKAMLLPLTSYGGTALVEYLSIANF